jgi:lipocalin-like protein
LAVNGHVEITVKAIRIGTLGVLVALNIFSQPQPQSTQKNHAAPGSGRKKLIGAWRLISIAAPGPDGKTMTVSHPAGMLIYTSDGHMSVQLMYAKSAGAVSNEYVLNGYEASFGSYDVNAATHTVTHHVQGSITRDLLVGKNLPRAYRITAGGELIIRSTRPDEHWSVTWKHY